MSSLFKRFSQSSRAILAEAQRIAERLRRPVSGDILLIAISGSPTAGAQLLSQVGGSYGSLLEQLTQHPQSASEARSEVEQTLLASFQLAARYGASEVHPEHLLTTLLREPGTAGELAGRLGIEPEPLVRKLLEWFSALQASQNPELQSGEERESVLERATVDLTQLAREGRLDPFVGRTETVEQVIRTLLRRQKANPVLVGDPGVGKTAIVEALAQRIAAGTVPVALRSKRILSLDLASLIAGTSYRGQFEERMRTLLDELMQQGSSILFLDEAHAMRGAGSGEGSLDVANLLKPALARGEISLIGATTPAEYREQLAPDRALARRLKVIQVHEPNATETLKMLKTAKRRYAEYHRVTVPLESLKAAVELAGRYLPDERFPDKAIDILDEACTYHAEQPTELDLKLDVLDQRIEQLESEKNQLVARAQTETDFALASQRATELSQARSEVRTIEKLLERNLRPTVTPTDVGRVLAGRLGTSLESIMSHLTPRKLDAYEVLRKYVLGQDSALKSIATTLERHQAGLHTGPQPIGSFLLVGPTGTGKTETARTIAREVFGDTQALIRLDMSEYREPHSVSRLIGSPPGYVGFGSGGQLTEAIRRRPHAVVLFDEVEKAHPDVFNLLLQVLDAGVLTDSQGMPVRFDQTLILLTSNLGTGTASIGFGDSDSALRSAVADFFRPEFLGRLTGICTYLPLSPATIQALARTRLKDLAARLATRDRKLGYDKQVVTWFASHYDRTKGVRSLDTLLRQEIEPVLLEALRNNEALRQLTLRIVSGKVEVHGD